MPTPKKTLIPVRMQPTSDLEPIHGKDVVYLPLDIPPGGTKRITNSIWARIKPPNRSHVDRTPYKAVSTISIEAVVPDLNRKLPCFEFSQNVTVQYPVTLVTDECKWLDTVPQGSSTSLQWAVRARERLSKCGRVKADVVAFTGNECLLQRSWTQQSVSATCGNEVILSIDSSCYSGKDPIP